MANAKKVVDLASRRRSREEAKKVTEAILPGATPKTRSLIQDVLELVFNMRSKPMDEKPKKKFWVSGILTVTFGETVEAETEEEAKAKVMAMNGVDLQWESEETDITDIGEIEEKSDG